MSIKWVRSDNQTITLPFPSLTAVNIGDLLWWNAAALPAPGAVSPAQLRPDLGSLQANQRDFANVFLGVSQDMRLPAEPSTGHDSQRVVVLDGVFDCDCSPQAWAVGDLVGIDRNVAIPGNFPQQVNKVTGAPQLSIGVVVPEWPIISSALVTRVRARLTARGYLAAPPLNPNFTSVAVLVDGNAVLTAGTSYFLNMAPSAPRTLTLPLESICTGLELIFSNRSLNGSSITFAGSGGAGMLAIQGNPVVPAGKVAQLASDGSAWNVIVSA